MRNEKHLSFAYEQPQLTTTTEQQDFYAQPTIVEGHYVFWSVRPFVRSFVRPFVSLSVHSSVRFRLKFLVKVVF